MKRNRSEPFVLLLLLLLLLVAVPASAESFLEGKSPDDDTADPCEDCDEGDTECCNNNPPNGDFKAGVHTVIGCDGGGDSGALEDLMLCIEGGLGGWPDTYDVEQVLDGIGIEYVNGDELECIGFSEDSVSIGTIRLRNPDPGKVARIDKFIEAPIGPTTTNPFFTAVYVVIDTDSFVIPTSAGMLLTDLNNAIENAIATKFNVTATDDYWIVGTKKQTAEFINLVKVRADDEGLLTMNVELRPVRFNPAQYDISCGQPGF